MKLYGGLDLHSTNTYMVLVDESGQMIYHKRLSNDIQVLRQALSAFAQIDSLVVESTYNWYWLVDGLMDAGYCVKLANPNAIQQYRGIKHTDDKTDARWLADLNRLNILPEGYIYPKQERGVRDLLRNRGQLVQDRTMHILSLKTIVERNTSIRLSANVIKSLTEEQLTSYLPQEDIFLAADSNRLLIHYLSKQISRLEKVVLQKTKQQLAYQKLTQIDGIGPILALTITLETGSMTRFAGPGNYASYCRCVGSHRVSNQKKKGENNRKNGNKYLCWAFVEAANFAIRHNETIKRYYQRKLNRTKRVVAIKTVAHKLARGCYYVMRDNACFDVDKLFAS